ncbi:hypothetical protein EVAR_100771_1 [Eumeta japonica]|uniref:Uncharacterized protein n=1 Tax=Eumeta variegata TaxID=151549 RepID=A0A4C1TD21_EUMVA|nr:hypothetical protein EVAR_100771_1 [Eumeta japonica]
MRSLQKAHLQNHIGRSGTAGCSRPVPCQQQRKSIRFGGYGLFHQYPEVYALQNQEAKTVADVFVNNWSDGMVEHFNHTLRKVVSASQKERERTHSQISTHIPFSRTRLYLTNTLKIVLAFNCLETYSLA